MAPLLERRGFEMPLMSVKGLRKRYGRNEALFGVDMSIEAGRVAGLLGPNGSGKTTLLKAIACLVQPDGGEIVYPYGARRGIESKKCVSFLPDQMALPEWMRVGDAFKYWREMFPDYSGERAEALAGILELSMEPRIKTLSKGMQERVALALTFARKAPLYLLDEPLGGIDPLGKTKVLESILSVQSEDSSILISTHLVKDVETVLDSYFFLSKGRVISAGDCETLREERGMTVEQAYLEVFAHVEAV
jgi:ABC-2 type transport system ATP-binding protein